MKCSNRVIAKNLYEVLKEADKKDIAQIAENFCHYLVSIRRLSAATRVLDELERFQEEQKGNLTVLIVSRYPLSKQVKEHVKTVFGRKIAIAEKQDTSLLGGFIITMNDILYDASVNTTIRQLKEHLIS